MKPNPISLHPSKAFQNWEISRAVSIYSTHCQYNTTPRLFQLLIYLLLLLCFVIYNLYFQELHLLAEFIEFGQYNNIIENSDDAKMVVQDFIGTVHAYYNYYYYLIDVHVFKLKSYLILMLILLFNINININININASIVFTACTCRYIAKLGPIFRTQQLCLHFCTGESYLLTIKLFARYCVDGHTN